MRGACELLLSRAANILAAAGIEKVDPAVHEVDIHALRHTFGTDPKLTAQTGSHLLSDDLRTAVEKLPTRKRG